MENSNNISVRKLVFGALVAAVYAAVSLALAPLSYGALQFRVAEALTLLPVLSASGVVGVTLGCAITNAVGAALGYNILGAADVLFGTAATLAAALLTRALGRFRVRGLPLLSALPPVIVNALVIGAELSWVTSGTLRLSVFTLFALQTGAQQLLPCLLGTFLVRALERRGITVN